MNFSISDQRHLDAAAGWLGLGDWRSANDELEEITAMMKAHPDVLRIRWEVFHLAKEWEMAAEVARSLTLMLPDNAFGFIHFAFALHEMKRTQEAQAVLLPVAGKFPDQYLISYNLACNCCQLGRREEAMKWLGRAMDLAGKKDIRQMASNDPDLEPLWNDISKL